MHFNMATGMSVGASSKTAAIYMTAHNHTYDAPSRVYASYVH